MPSRRRAVAWRPAAHVLVVILTAALPRAASAWGGPSQAELDRLGSTLGLRSGMVVADVGAGDGDYTLWAARAVSPGGRVYSTEIDPEKRKTIGARVRAVGLQDVTVIEAGASETGLAEKYCNAIFMRDVYHHLTEPADRREPPASAAPRRPARGDRLPADALALAVDPKGDPRESRGHGIASALVVEELTARGFELVRVSNEWPAGWLIAHYCALFRRPASEKPALQ